MQLEHDDRSVLPEAVENVSAGQSVQSVLEAALTTAEYLPGRHSIQDLAISRAEYLPPTQLWQEAMSVPPVADENLPLPQAVHAVDPAVLE